MWRSISGFSGRTPELASLQLFADFEVYLQKIDEDAKRLMLGCEGIPVEDNKGYNRALVHE